MIKQRQRLVNLHTNEKEKKPIGLLEPGEIGIRHSEEVGSQRLFIETVDGSQNEDTLVEFVPKTYVDEKAEKAIERIDSKVFIGTEEEYNTAYAEGKIAMGALVIILDGSETEEGGATISALLGTAILGQMLLGQK